MTSVAFLFSGQGAQKPGMGAGLLDAGIPEVDETFACASDIFGFDVADACMHASAQQLNETRLAQPATCVTSIAVARALIARGVSPSFVAGHSLGQMSALAISGMLSLEDTFALAARRALVMERATHEADGAMCAIMGGSPEEVEALCACHAGAEVLVPANYNAPGQIVISGHRAAVERARQAWTGPGRRSVMLATSGAFHSPLMEGAARELAPFVRALAFAPARIPLVCNVSARPLDASDAAEHVIRQITSPVRFCESVLWLREEGVGAFVECGFGGVLAGLVRRIDKDAVRLRAESAETIEQAVQQLG